MIEELDYSAEADSQRTFAAALADDPKVRIPKVVASAPKVIISEWMPGRPLSEFAHRPAADAEEQKLRDWIAETVMELHFSSPARVGLLHSDPHHGNFRLLPDGRLGMIDFGAVTRLPDGIPRPLGRILRLAADERADEMMDLLRAEGFVGLEDKVTAEDVMRYIGALANPLREETFHYNRGFMQAEGGRVTAPGSVDFRTGRAMSLPPQYLMFLRVVVGWMSMLAKIDRSTAGRRAAESWPSGSPASPTTTSPVQSSPSASRGSQHTESGLSARRVVLSPVITRSSASVNSAVGEVAAAASATSRSPG